MKKGEQSIGIDRWWDFFWLDGVCNPVLNVLVLGFWDIIKSPSYTSVENRIPKNLVYPHIQYNLSIIILT